MEENYIEIVFETESRELGEILIACLNDAMEMEGFEEGDGFVKAYIPATKYDEALFKRLPLPGNIKYTQSVIKNKNWNAIWEKEFEPVIIGDKVAIRAEFHKPIADVEYEIVITPKMSFGTGHHATTGMMVESLYQYGCSGKRWLILEQEQAY